MIWVTVGQLRLVHTIKVKCVNTLSRMSKDTVSILFVRETILLRSRGLKLSSFSIQ